MVFARLPRAGHVKTRMTPPLDPAEAAELYGCMLEDVLEVTARAAGELGLEPILSVHPPEAAAALAARAPAGFQVVGQRGPDLGARMAVAVAEAAAAGHSPILLRGSDSPILDVSAIRDALDALEEVSVVVCPDLDGGYNLVGLHEPISGLFSHTMSASTTLEELCLHAGQRRLRVRRLATRFDVDTVDDLSHLATARAAGDTLPCPRTLACCDENDLWRHLRHAP